MRKIIGYLLSVSAQTIACMWSPSEPLILAIRNASTQVMTCYSGDSVVKITPNSCRRVLIKKQAFIDTPNATYNIFAYRIEGLLEIRFVYNDEDEYTHTIERLSTVVEGGLSLDGLPIIETPDDNVALNPY